MAVKSRANIVSLLEGQRFAALTDPAGDILAVAALVAPDRSFWAEDPDVLGSAWYVGRFMTAASGYGYGSTLLRHLAACAAADGRAFLRLDCWKTNTGLHRYYLGEGFTHVRTVDVPGRFSGALFQRPVRVRPDMLLPELSFPDAWDHPGTPA